MEREHPEFRLSLTTKFVILALLLVALEVLSMTAYPALKHQRSPFGQAFKLRSLMTPKEGFLQDEAFEETTVNPNNEQELKDLLQSIENKNKDEEFDKENESGDLYD